MLWLIVYSAAVFLAGALVHRAGFVQSTVKRVSKQAQMMPRVVKGMMARPERILIDIKHENIVQIVAKREEALRAGFLISSDDDFVGGSIRHGDDSVDVKLRLKGDMRDHWDTVKWSYRVVVKGDETLFGMKQFSLQHPKTRDYLGEWLYHRVLRREGLIGLRYDFIDVAVNGNDLGLYALEEHFEKRLVEHNRRREGPIVRFNEDLSWAEALHYGDRGLGFARARAGSGAYLASEVDGFQTGKWLGDEEMKAVYSRATQLLDGFRRNDLEVEQVFDIDQLARYFALSELFGALHSANWRNARFYYNPITSRLEPIGFDGGAGRELRHLALGRAQEPLQRTYLTRYQSQFWSRLFDNETFRNAYLGQLERVSKPAFLDALFAELDPELQSKLVLLRREWPELQWSNAVFYGNARYMRRMLHPVQGVRAYLHSVSPETIEVELANLQSMPLVITGLSGAGSSAELSQQLELPGRRSTDLVAYRVHPFPAPPGFDVSTVEPELQLQFQVAGTDERQALPVLPFARTPEMNAEDDLLRRTPNLAEHEFITVDESNLVVSIRAGRWPVPTDIIVPAGYTLSAGAGTELHLSDGASIVSHSPLRWVGSEGSPVVIDSPDSNGGGVVVLGDGETTSTLEHVVFRNLSNPREEGWSLTGAVTFCRAPVDVHRVVFDGNRAEDSLNIVDASFEISDTEFLHATSDALDVDFGRGRIVDSTFVDSFNDAVDISGSIAEIEGLIVRGAGDKGVSVGEESRAIVTRADISDATIGVASKDRSLVTLTRSSIRDTRVALAAYQKKSEFGGAEIDARELRTEGIESTVLRDDDSSIALEGSNIGEPVSDAVQVAEALVNARRQPAS